MPDFCRFTTPEGFVPFGAESESAAGKACMVGVKEPLGGGGGGDTGGGGGGVVEGGGGGGVVDGGGGGGVVDGGGGGGGVVPAAVTVREIGTRHMVETFGPDSPR